MRKTEVVRLLLAGMVAVLGGCSEIQGVDDAPVLAPGTVAQALPLGAVQVRDINTRPVRFPQHDPGSVALGGGVSLFVANDELHGRELWRSDGTEAGTSLVRDLVPGLPGSNPRLLTLAQGTVFFSARSGGADDFGAEELWKTDGTPAGTVLVKRLLSTSNSDQIGAMVQVGGTVFFIYHQYDGNYLQQLWKSDGTAAGTVLLQQLAPTDSCGCDFELISTGTAVFFTGRDAANNLQVWKRDGAGAVLLATIPVPSGSFISSHLLTQVGSSLFFTVDKVLWKSDGTPAGTVPVATQSSRISDLEAVNGTLFLSSSTSLWKSNGTAPVLIRTFDDAPGSLTALGNTLYFIGTDALGGRELWTSDGTTAGTRQVKDVLPGADGSAPQELLAWNGGLYFTASTTVGTRGLWRSDGTATGTLALKTWAEVENPWYSVSPTPTPVGSALFFSVPEGPVDPDSWLDRRPRSTWRTTGTVKGTRELAGVWAGTRSSQLRQRPLGVVGGTVFFVASDGNPGEALWKSDGTAAGTVQLRALARVAPEEDTWLRRPGAAHVGGTLFFTADDGVHGLELWKSDGTAVGTVLVKDLRPGPDPSQPEELTAFNGALFFTAYDDVNGMSLWRSDGTEAGTVPVKSMGQEDSSGSVDELTAMGGLLYFEADDSLHDPGLWKTDGTPGGTSLVKVPFANAYASLGMFMAVNGTLFFSARDGYGVTQLWKSDGTQSGTVLVKGGFEALEMSHPVTSQGVLYFTADEGVHGYELWRSDGTEAGTRLLKDIHPGLGSSGPHALTPTGSGLVFVAYEETHGWELWRTDGTEAGTRLLVDLLPGPQGGVRARDQDYLVDILGLEDRGLALFSGVDEAGGAELWRTDGTVAGTFRMLDVVPGSGSSEPDSFAHVGDRLFFMAGDKAYGREPRFLAIPRDLGSATGNAVVQGSTCTAASQVTPSCTYNALAPDSTFAWTAPSAGLFTFSTEGSSYDTSLEVSDSASGTSLGCNDDANETLQSSVAVSLSAGQTVLITVDGYDTECGPFVLNIHPSP
ncbi:ELWxxDGT repeat protein [Archangium lipolyticum]|uniref:ELWxxDGT repeat protein n=1 Tax=Archangium lipolyticum TaxID=2970465 RepID=UPI002149A06A|nr:ELWxxDGT repeat protein [Archangium lipolyticum]